MLKNYFLLAFRNFRKNKLFSFINILGLAIGISASLVIYLLVQYDFTFDKFEKDGDRIYRVVSQMNFAGESFPNSGVPAPLPAAAQKEIPGLDLTVAFHQFHGEPNVSIPGEKNTGSPVLFKKQHDVAFADDRYFDLIPYHWLAGSAGDVLSIPFTVVLTESRANAYFPHQPLNSMIGRRVVYNDTILTTVTGIVADLEANSDFTFKEFVSLSTIPSTGLKKSYGLENWGSINSSSQFFIKLGKGTLPSATVTKLTGLLAKNDPHYKNRGKDDSFRFELQRLSDIHFNTRLGTYGDRQANKQTLYGLLAVAAFLLLLGCINFVNLTTAQASRRAREIGVRKTMGSSRRQLIGQFLTETFCVTLIATLLSVVLTPILFKIFSDFIPADLHVHLFSRPDIFLFLLILTALVALLAGLYPAWILSRYNPTVVLKSQAVTGTSGHRAWLRKSLTVSQFFIAQVFVMATFITGKQIYYMMNADLGFRKEAIISVGVPFTFYNFSHPDPKRFVLLDKLRSIPGIEMISLAGSTPQSNSMSASILHYKDGKKEITTDVEQKNGDTNFLRLFHIPILAGRNVQPSDTIREYVINETYLHILGFQKPEEALGKIIDGIPIVGVMADFHQRSMQSEIKPLAFAAQSNFAYAYQIALRPQDASTGAWPGIISRIGDTYKDVYPNADFDYKFFDQTIAGMYKSEQNTSRLLKWATGLAIFISCMGLLGLVMYITNQRRKEIGVRKVLGASVTHIIGILSGDFIKLVGIAFLLAIPVVWYGMHKWLQDFAYKTEIPWWLFAASGLVMLLLALLTMSLQTLRAASANPVESLRTE